MIISAFAGVGKTTLANSRPDAFIDLESSYFKWEIPEEQLKMSVEERKGLPKAQSPKWPQNYIDEILRLESLGTKFVMISMDKDVRSILESKGIPFTLIYPDKSMKEEFIQRLINRGNNDKFIELIKLNFESWIDDLDKQKQDKLILNKGMYISDLF